MNPWEWETFASLLNNGTFTISDAGPAARAASFIHHRT